MTGRWYQTPIRTSHGSVSDTADMPADELLSTAEAARRLGVAPVTIRWLIRAGRLPARRPYGPGWLVSVADLDAYASTRRPAGFQPGNAAWRRRVVVQQNRHTPAS